jgi:uncharacterized membrane protein YoaK (UPF0700 family)
MICAMGDRNSEPPSPRRAAGATSGGSWTAPSPAGWRDLLLVTLTAAAGAVDAVSFLGLGGLFTANMTGNIVLLGLAVGRAAGLGVLRSGVALLAFAAGVVVGTRIIGPAGRAAVWPRRVTVALAVELIVQVAFLGGWLVTDGRPDEAGTALLVALSAAAMGVQSAAARSLAVPSVATTFVTGTLTGLMSELAALTRPGPGRARRVGVIAVLPVGAAAGALLLADARVAAPAVPVVLVASVVLAATVFLRDA